MTVTELAEQVQGRLQLSSQASLDRIKAVIKERYGWVLSRLGTRLVTLSTTTANTTTGQRTVTFTNTQKVFSVAITGGARLDEYTYDQLKNTAVAAGNTPTKYAIAAVTDTTVTILLNSTPSSAFGLTAEVAAYVDATALADGDTPAFHANFHDILVHGAMATELLRMEKPELADRKETLAEKRTAQLDDYLKEHTS